MKEERTKFEEVMKAEIRTYISLLLRWERYLHFRSALARKFENLAKQIHQQAETIESLAQERRADDEARLIELEQKIPTWGSYLNEIDEVHEMEPAKQTTDQPFLTES